VATWEETSRYFAVLQLRDMYAVLAKHEAHVAKTSAARMALPAGSSRAKVTTANARWMRACEARDRHEAAIRKVREEDRSLP
jgi:hypothetical protein